MIRSVCDSGRSANPNYNDVPYVNLISLTQLSNM